MVERLLLEGEDLPELMLRVRDEFGPRATIVRAERVRYGGIAGFFAREHYELTVEVPDPARPAVAAPRAAVAPMVLPPDADGLEALLDAADRAEAGLGAGSGTGLGTGVGVGTGRGSVLGSGLGSVPGADPFGRSDEEPLPVSTAGARFEEVLQGVRALAGASAGAGTVAGATVAGAGTTGAGAPAAVPRPAVVVRAPEPPPASSDATRGLPWGQAAVALLAAGVPSSMLDQAGSVAEVLDRIAPPPQPPRQPGHVLVLVGPHEAAAATATLLCHQWQLPAESVVEAGPEGLTSTTAVVRWRMHTATAGHPWLLVVGVGEDPTARQLATGLVAAAQPEQVWAVVDARTKRDDLARWLEQIGAARRPDALAVRGLLDTSDPGTVLGLGLPVAWADGMPASRVLWATVLGQGIDVALGRHR